MMPGFDDRANHFNKKGDPGGFAKPFCFGAADSSQPLAPNTEMGAQIQNRASH